MTIWQDLVEKALSSTTQVSELYRPTDPQMIYAAAPGTNIFRGRAKGINEKVVAVIIAEWQREEAFGDDAGSMGGYKIEWKSGSVPVSATALVRRGDDGTLSLGNWVGEDGRERQLPAKIAATLTKERVRK